MNVRQLRVGTMANFVYLVSDEESRQALVVDSGWETAPILKAADESAVDVKYVVATHEHFDHTSTIQELAGRLGAKVVAHRASPVACDVRVVDGSELALGRTGVRVLHTPGHTEDSICLYDGREVFTGDTLFVGTIGRFDSRRAAEVYRSLYEVILGLPEATEMYPGHDYGDVSHRSLKEEKEANPYLGCKDLRSFLSLFS
ncbi:MAG TPA: hydroxyacylglutathione hydrolase family protein [Nitrososphaerales archaeon]|nr:hydroxyacylglutathione hydrolase family protein [Nitrososphaerales archaeon]